MVWLYLLLFYFIGTLLVHSAACYIISASNTLIKFIITGTIIGLCLMINLYIIWGISLELISGTLIYAFACEFYIFVFGFVSTSISVSIVLRTHQKIINVDDLANSYSGKVMVAARLNRLQEFGLLSITNDKIELTDRGVSLKNKFNRWHKFLNLKEGFNAYETGRSIL